MTVRVGLLSLILFLFACNASKEVVSNSTSNTKQASPKKKKQDEQNALLWKIEKEGYHSSHLLGTIHMISAQDFFFPTAFEQALDEAKMVTLEFDLSDAMDMNTQMQMMQKALMTDGRSLKDLISAEDYAVVDNHFKELGIPLFLLEKMKPMFLSIMAESQQLMADTNGMKSYELEIMNMTKEKSKEMAGLETMEYQLSIFDSIPYEEQAEMLVTSIKTGADNSELDALIEAYKAQDLETLSSLISSSEDYSEYTDLLLNDRNKNWIPVMEAQMSENPVFFAVGAGHLVGAEGVIQLLRNQGFTLTPIKTN